jgi:hypothetical protein
MGSDAGRRVRRLRNRRVVVLEGGGHHVHLGEEGSRRVVEALEGWTCSDGGGGGGGEKKTANHSKKNE